MIKKATIILICIISLISLFTFSSCKKIKDFSDMESIIYPAILSEEGNSDGKYFIFIYGDNCTYCEELLPLLCEYANMTKKNKEMIPLYALNSSNTRVNVGLIKDDDSEFDDFLGTSNWEDIHIANTPALILVEKGVVKKYISSKTTQRPKTEIKEYITKVMDKER